MPVYRATVRSTFNAGSGVGTNSWTLRTVGGGLEGGDIDSLMAVVKQFYTDLALWFPLGHSFTWDGTLTELATPDPEFRAPREPWTVLGLNNGVYGPAPAAACVTWRTSLAGRSGRGRTFLSPLASEAFQGDGSLNNTFRSTVVTAAADLVTASDDIGETVGALAVWSETDGVARDIIGATVTDQAAVLRSRR